ncbi:probable aquaporin NIP-type [Phalaenopsis equestris]|uniref:probable aquaporin NIP-type n=1 Tax=Phalaenopsis equestris TaxID=78828 RepID=UPI0009E5ED06|nr:probable aquaporin NIP-type [Phalaenopsis equestris]
MKNCPVKPGNVSLLPENQKLLSVFLATYTFMFVGCASLYMEKRGEITFIGVCLAWGGIVTANIYTFGHISGAHINPAITFAYAVVGQFPWKQVPFYLLGEFVGSAMASLTLKWIFDGENPELMLTRPAAVNPASDFKVLVLEVFITFIYVLNSCSSRMDPRGFKELGGVAVGITVFFLALVAGKITGASMNPARTLGPAIVAWNFDKIWIYFIAPLIGAVLATTLYFFHLCPSQSNGDNKQQALSFFELGTMNRVLVNDTLDISVVSNNLGEKSAEIELSRSSEHIHGNPSNI